jgi:hypothetical protein
VIWLASSGCGEETIRFIDQQGPGREWSYGFCAATALWRQLSKD